MIGTTLAWATTHPMHAMGVMVAFAILVGFAGISAEMRRRIDPNTHPRC
jgi:hypothetical protein